MSFKKKSKYRQKKKIIHKETKMLLIKILPIEERYYFTYHVTYNVQQQIFQSVTLTYKKKEKE